MLFETGPVDQFEDWGGAIHGSRTHRARRRKSDFAMLACATNPFQFLASGHAIRGAADHYFSTSESLLVLLDCGGAADGRDLADAHSGDSAAAARRSGAFAARHALAGVRTRLRVWNSLVCWDLLLDLRHHASLRRHADSGRGVGAGLVLHVCWPLSRDVRAAGGRDGWVEFRWTEGRRIGSLDQARAGGSSVSLGRGGTRPDADYGVSLGASRVRADREFCNHADCDAHRRLWAVV